MIRIKEIKILLSLGVCLIFLSSQAVFANESFSVANNSYTLPIVDDNGKLLPYYYRYSAFEEAYPGYNPYNNYGQTYPSSPYGYNDSGYRCYYNQPYNSADKSGGVYICAGTDMRSDMLKKISLSLCSDVDTKITEISYASTRQKYRIFRLSNGSNFYEFGFDGKNATFQSQFFKFYKSLFPKLNVRLYRDVNSGICRIHLPDQNYDPYVYQN